MIDATQASGDLGTETEDEPVLDETDRIPRDGRLPSDDDLGRWGKHLTWILAAMVVVRVGAVLYLVLTHQETIDGGLAGDVRRYIEMATAKGLPYRDFQVEYPPITYAIIRLLAGSGDLGSSIRSVAISQFFCDLAIAGVIRWGWGKRASLAYLLLGLPLICWPFIYARIDLFTVLLTVASLALIRRGRDLRGGALLAVAILAKIWPFATAPALLIERKGRGITALAVSGFVLSMVWLLVGTIGGPQQVLSFRDATGWQVESLPGILWHMRDPSRVKFESGAFRTGIMPLWARPMLTLLSILFVALAWVWAERRRRAGADDHVVYALAPLGSVLSLLIFAPILSPQYVVWMLPFAAMVVARGDRLIARLTVAVVTVSTISYVLVPSAAEGKLWATTPVLVRNVLLVALFVVAMRRLAAVPLGDQAMRTRVMARMRDITPTRSIDEVSRGTP